VRKARGEAPSVGADPSRLVLVGHSAGAYNAAMLALDPRGLGAERRAVKGWVGLAGPYDFLPLKGPVTRAAFGHASDLEATQPINLVAPGAPPCLLLHGGRDETVLPRNSRELARRLKAAAVDARVKVYPVLGHVETLTAIARPLRHRAPVLADTLAFAREVAATPARD
jgi:acetyl esterase/lipase